ncbi:MAG: hypothetical protein L3J28_10585 [Candidatus Polarisedimenticolaceae bacterium]|nr:hypothetical protein [Candidatus Polarisedimenticolaceae bacterium]
MSEDEAHPPAAVGSIQPHTQQVLVEQVQLLYSNALTANIAVIAAAIFCTTILWSYIDPLPLLTWSITLMTAALIRLSIIHNCHPQLQPSTAETLAKYYIGSTLLVSMAWSGFSLFLYQSDSPFVFSFVYIITFIVITASIPVLSVVQGAFFSYNLPPAITLTAVLLVNEAPHSQLFAAGVIIYFTLIAITGMNLNQRIVKSLKLEINNKELITHLIDEVERRVETQYDLEASKAVAEQANQSKSEFLANMSHEIRTPLHAIIGISELALLDEQSSEQKEYSRIINHTGLHLLRIVDGILDLSKIEAGKLEIEQKDFNMEEVL